MNQRSVRELNSALHAVRDGGNVTRWRVLNPRGLHAVAAGVDADVTVEIDGDVGYYCAGMNKRATVIVNGNAGIGLGENMMSGLIYVKGDASQAAGATAHGRRHRHRGQRLGALRHLDERRRHRRQGFDRPDVGLHGAGGNAGGVRRRRRSARRLRSTRRELFVRGAVKSLGADCVEKPMDDMHRAELFAKFQAVGVAGEVDVGEFRRYGSARTLYHFHVDNAGAY